MFVPQQHLEPISNKNGFGLLCEWVEVHTYDNGDHELALISVHGNNDEDFDLNIDLWLREDEIVALRDALTSIIGNQDA